jgi:hypothetical protein
MTVIRSIQSAISSVPEPSEKFAKHTTRLAKRGDSIAIHGNILPHLTFVIRSFAIKIIDKQAKGFDVPALQKEIHIMKLVCSLSLMYFSPGASVLEYRVF